MYRIAIYRIHYGLEYLEQSINSILEDVDHVFVFHSTKPWSKRGEVTYLGETFPLPQLEEDVQQFCADKFNSKVKYIQQEFDTSEGQWTTMYNHVAEHYGEAHQTLMMDPDMVFAPGDAKKLFDHDCAFVNVTQIELWKGMNNRIPQRQRIGPTIWNVPPVYTGKGTEQDNNLNVHPTIQCYNFGFCMSPKIMFYKHLVALMGSADIGDSIPAERWFIDKWTNWEPETQDLEISANHAATIKQIEPYNAPHDIQQYMNLLEST